MVDVAITIVNYHTGEDTIECLDSLYRDLQGSKRSLKVIVADNSPEDELTGTIRKRYPEVKILPAPRNLGFGGGHNLAIESIDARYYLILNPDITFPENGKAVDRMFAWMESNPKAGMLAPKLRDREGSLHTSCYSFPTFWSQPVRRLNLQERFHWARKLVDHFLMKDFDREETRPVDWVMGAAMFLRKEALEDTGAFDPRYFMYYEDVDLCRRFWRSDWPVYYLHEVELTHGHRRSSRTHSGLRDILVNPLTRVHLASWLKYFSKWEGRGNPRDPAP